MTTKAADPFWLTGVDVLLATTCQYHPEHRWTSFRVGDAVEHTLNPNEILTICRSCFAPRCGSADDTDRCTLWRGHTVAHVLESGAMMALVVEWE